MRARKAGARSTSNTLPRSMPTAATPHHRRTNTTTRREVTGGSLQGSGLRAGVGRGVGRGLGRAVGRTSGQGGERSNRRGTRRGLRGQRGDQQAWYLWRCTVSAKRELSSRLNMRTRPPQSTQNEWFTLIKKRTRAWQASHHFVSR